VASSPEALAALIQADLALADPSTYLAPASPANTVAVDVVARTLTTVVVEASPATGRSSKVFRTLERFDRRREGTMLSPEADAKVAFLGMMILMLHLTYV